MLRPRFDAAALSLALLGPIHKQVPRSAQKKGNAGDMEGWEQQGLPLRSPVITPVGGGEIATNEDMNQPAASV